MEQVNATDPDDRSGCHTIHNSYMTREALYFEFAKAFAATVNTLPKGKTGPHALM